MNKVQEFNICAGLVDMPAPEAIRLQCKAFAEDAKEFWDAWEDGSEIKMLDAIADSQFVYSSLSLLCFYQYRKQTGLNHQIKAMQEIAGVSRDVTDEAFRRVCDSNLTKFDLTENDAIVTREKYDNYETRYEFVNGLYVTRLDEDCMIGHKGKVLKSHNFKPVQLADLV